MGKRTASAVLLHYTRIVLGGKIGSKIVLFIVEGKHVYCRKDCTPLPISDAVFRANLLPRCPASGK